MGVVLAVGTVGFRLAIHESWLQSFYRAVVSSTLTGLDTVPRNDSARIVTIFLVLAGISIFAYIGSLVVEAIPRGVIGGLWAERRRRRAIDALRDHYIICGFGRVGQRVAEEFRHEGAPFAVVDYSPAAKAAAEEGNVRFVEGNGTDDDDLRAAGQAAGRVMANLLLKPQVTAFVDVVTSAGGADLRFEEVEVAAACGQGGRTIRDLEIRRATRALIVALRKRDGTFDTTPTPEAVVELGDVLIAAGTEDELRALEGLFAPRETVAC